jgi:hypothetical protein
MAPDRFRNAFRIRFRLALPFGTDHTCTCGFSLRDENDSHPLRCNAHGSNYACQNSTLAFVKSLARDAGYHAPKGDFCVRESSPSADGVRADGFIALADEDPSKDLIIDVFGSDPSNISFIRASSNILFEKAFEAGYKKKDATYRGLVNSLLALPSSVPSDSIYVLCLIDLHKQSTTTRKTRIAALFPALGNTTLISGPSYACLCLPPHSPKLGICLLRSLTMHIMLNATIYMQDVPLTP